MHIAQDELEAFVFGRLPDADSERVQAHLDVCQACSRRLPEIDLGKDDLVILLRKHAARQAPDDAFPLFSDKASVPSGSTPLDDGAGATSVAERSELPPVVGPYEILGELGRGGMGVVYRAHDPRVDRDVALKVIHPRHVAREEARTLIGVEARAAARLQHPNIVSIYEFDVHDGIAACVFEYVHGGSLADRIRSSRMDPRAAARLVAVLADAVHYAHQEQIVHRDLKPANILLAPDGTPKIADFGLAKILDDARGTSLDGRLAGSPSYMAPEQAAGTGAAVGPAADIYALGAILYELLTGQPPFRGPDPFEILDRVRNAAPLPPRQFAPHLDGDLEAVCLACLHKKPEDRYPSAAELAADLRRFLAFRPVSVRKSGWIERSVKFVRGRPVESVIGAALAITLCVFVVFAAMYYVGRERSRDFERRTAFAVQLQQAATLSATDPVAARQLLHDPQRCPPDLRDFCWGHLQSISQQQRGLWQNGTEVQVLAAAEQGDLFAAGDRQGVLRLWSAGEERPRWEVPAHGQVITDIRFIQSDQRIVAASEDGTLSFWTLAGQQAEPAWNPAAGPINGIAVSPDGTGLATAHAEGQISVWNLATRTAVADLPGHRASVFRTAFNADGRYLASGSRDETLRVWRVADGREIAVPNEHRGFVTDVRFHPRDPHQLATACGDRTVRQWRISPTGQVELVRSLRGFAESISALACSHDGTFLAAGSYDGTVRVWNGETGQLVTSRYPYRGGVSSLTFDHAGRILAGTKTGQIERWSLDGTDRTLSFRGHDGPLSGLAFLPGGEALVSGGLDGKVHVWNATDASHLAVWQDADDWVAALACASDRTQFVWECAGKLYRSQFRPPASLVHQQVPGSFSAQALAYSRTGERLLVADVTGLQAVDAATGAAAWSWDEGVASCLATSPTADLFAAASEGDRIGIGPTRTGQLVSRAAGVGGVRCLRFSADGTRLAIGGSDGRIAIQRAAGGRVELTISGPAVAVLCLAFSPDGQTLASGGEDGEVRFWDPQAGCERLRLPVGGPVRYVDFSPDGQRLACGTDEGEIRIWQGEY